MAETINYGLFIQHLTYYLKMGIYINKGTTKDNILNNCVKLYNKYKTVEASNEVSEKDEKLVIRCIKRLNLILRVHDDGKAIDITDKNVQRYRFELAVHPSIAEDDSYQMMKHAEKHNINILTGVPLTFMIRSSKFDKLMWQYTRSLFYISQFIIAKVPANANTSDPKVARIIAASDDAIQKLLVVLEKIEELESKLNVHNIIASDVYLNKTLIKTGINEHKVTIARDKVKELFNKKGLKLDSMVDTISDKLSATDLEQGNLLKNVFEIAEGVAHDVRNDVNQDPDKFSKVIGAIGEIFKETMAESNDEEIPSEFKSMFEQLLNVTPVDENGNRKELDEKDIKKFLEGIIETNNLNRDEFFQSIESDNGDIDITKLETVLTSISKNANEKLDSEL